MGRYEDRMSAAALERRLRLRGADPERPADWLGDAQVVAVIACGASLVLAILASVAYGVSLLLGY